MVQAAASAARWPPEEQSLLLVLDLADGRQHLVHPPPGPARADGLLGRVEAVPLEGRQDARRLGELLPDPGLQPVQAGLLARVVGGQAAVDVDALGMRADSRGRRRGTRTAP